MPDAIHLIIAGSNKCGTTSLFRYLCDHQEVCGSATKEAHFFFRDDILYGEAAYETYRELFASGSESHRVLLEATPAYVDGGLEMANRIHAVLPDPYIIVMLREPTDRLISYYRSSQGRAGWPATGLSFSEFVARILDARRSDSSSATAVDRELALQVRKGEYAAALGGYYSVFSNARILIVFFEAFRANPAANMASVCEFVGLSSAFYRDYDFTVENRSRYHRSPAIRTLASYLNQLLEPTLNRLPAVRRKLRSGYDYINTSQSKSHIIDEESVLLLREYYAPHNRALRSLLDLQLNSAELPTWLRPDESMTAIPRQGSRKIRD